MTHAYSMNLYHLVMATAGRAAWFTGDREVETHKYMAGTLGRLDVSLLAIGGWVDHVHLLCSIPPKMSVMEVVQKLKANTSRWFRKRFGAAAFGWQEGYASFTVSFSQRAAVAQYIQNQHAHHRTRTFADEYAAFLGKHGFAPVGDTGDAVLPDSSEEREAGPRTDVLG